MKAIYLLLPVLFLVIHPLFAQPVLETGGKLPETWIDKDTGHKLIRLSRVEGKNSSFYFHNNPFISTPEGVKMLFFNTGKEGTQAFTVNMKTMVNEQLTHIGQYGKVPVANNSKIFDRERNGHNGEALGIKTHNLYYQVTDSVLVTNVDTKKTKLVYVFPKGFNGGIFTLNADETILAGLESRGADSIAQQYPVNTAARLFAAHVPHTLFTIKIATGELKKVHTENNYLNHIQFSPADPNLLMFCREGPWQDVDRIWTIDIKTGAIRLMHARTVTNEIAGHEFFSPDGKKIWFDLQVPRSTNFFLAGSNVSDQKETRYQLTRDEWSIHYNISPDQKLFTGEGGNKEQVAGAADGRWIYLFRPEGDHFKSERLVNMKNHIYSKETGPGGVSGLEPNVRFSPDGKWVIFRANFEGTQQVYAVEVAKAALQR